MKILIFLHDAFGGLGGIARNNRDVIDGLAADARISGIVAVPLKLTKKAKKRLSQKGKLKLSVAVKFTPTGGTPNSKGAALKITQKRKKKG